MNSRVYLSPIGQNHIFHLIGFSNDPELIETMGWIPFQPNEGKRFLRTIGVITLPDAGSGSPKIFCIITHQNNTPIGYVTLKGLNKVTGKAELGIAIMDRKFRSGGYGTGALMLAADHGFNSMHLLSLGLTVFPSNTRAIKAYKKVGFEKIDILKRSWTMPSGKKVDMILMELNNKAY